MVHITWLNFNLRRPVAKGPIRAVTLSVNQETFDLIKNAQMAEGLRHEADLCRRAIEQYLGLAPGSSAPENK